MNQTIEHKLEFNYIDIPAPLSKGHPHTYTHTVLLVHRNVQDTSVCPNTCTRTGHLLLDVHSVLCQQTRDDGILGEGLVVHELCGRKGGHGIEEADSCLLEVPDGESVQSLVGLEPVPAVPVSALFYQAVCM